MAADTSTEYLKQVAAALYATGYTHMSAAVIAVTKERNELRDRLRTMEQRAETAERIIRNWSRPPLQFEDMPWIERLKRMARFK